MGSPTRLIRSAKRWWNDSSYLDDVALVFTVITVVNSVMMLTGWDTPKTGSFAYTHLLSRLAIVAAVVGLFHLDDLREHVERRRDRDRRVLHASGRDTSAVELITRYLPRSPSSRVAVVFTVATAVLCVVAIASSVWREPRGGVVLYRAVLVLAAATAGLVGVGTRLHRSQPARSRHLVDDY